jgi:hypothetical protein
MEGFDPRKMGASGIPVGDVQNRSGLDLSLIGLSQPRRAPGAHRAASQQHDGGCRVQQAGTAKASIGLCGFHGVKF